MKTASTFSVFIIVTSTVLSGIASAEMYKCKKVSGGVEYSDSPCASGYRWDKDRWVSVEADIKRRHEEEILRKETESRQRKEQIEKPSPVVIGTLADTILELRGKAQSTRQVGRDANGLLVEWEYSDVTYLMGRLFLDGVEAYRVIKIKPRK